MKDNGVKIKLENVGDITCQWFGCELSGIMSRRAGDAM